MPTILAIDLGTSRIRAGLFDCRGASLGVSAFEYPILSPSKGAAEQEPRLWEEGFYRSVKEVLASAQVEEIEGLAISGQMHGTALVDRAGRPLGNAIIWCDQRGGEAIDWIYHRIGGVAAYQSITGNPLATGFQAATLGFLKEYHPNLLEHCYKVLLPKDYLISRLTGEFVTEPTDAVSTGLFDLDLPHGKQFRWSEGLLEIVGLSVSQFPEIVSSLCPPDLRLTQEAALRVGLPPGLPVVAFGGDAVLGATFTMEQGKTDEAVGLISSGGQLLVSRKRPFPNPGQGVHLLPQIEPEHWLNMAAFLAAGLSLEWWRGALETWTRQPCSISDLLLAAAEVPPGSEGLCFLPHIAGERTPLLDPEARGMFWGIGSQHKLEHFCRAILEGVAFSFRWGLEILEATGGKVTSFTIGGGGTRSPLWCQIFADVLGREVHTLSEMSETSLSGAALAGAKALGWDTKPWHPPSGKTFQPARDRFALESGFQQSKQLAPFLRESASKHKPCYSHSQPN